MGSITTYITIYHLYFIYINLYLYVYIYIALSCPLSNYISLIDTPLLNHSHWRYERTNFAISWAPGTTLYESNQGRPGPQMDCLTHTIKLAAFWVIGLRWKRYHIYLFISRSPCSSLHESHLNLWFQLYFF